jgi:hypothetical protein
MTECTERECNARTINREDISGTHRCRVPWITGSSERNLGVQRNDTMRAR